MAGSLGSSPALVQPTQGGSPVLARSTQSSSPASRGSPNLPRNLTPRKKEDGAGVGPTAAKLHRGKLIGGSIARYNTHGLYAAYNTHGLYAAYCTHGLYAAYSTPVLCNTGTSSYGYSVYVGLDSSGELVALYEWVLHCRPAKRGHADLGMAAARRVKQVSHAWTSGGGV